MLVYFIGLTGFYFWSGLEAFLWFAVGGGLAVVNIFFAAWVLRFGFQGVKQKGMFLGILMVKSLTFLAVVACILMFLKPLLLPFTLGLGVVIFSTVLAALWESRKYFQRPPVVEDH